MTQNAPHNPRPSAPTVLAKTSGGRALLFNYQKGEGLPPHTHAGQLVIVAVLGGQIQISVDGELHTIGAGEVTTVQTEGHFSSLALEDHTKVLVTLLDN